MVRRPRQGDEGAAAGAPGGHKIDGNEGRQRLRKGPREAECRALARPDNRSPVAPRDCAEAALDTYNDARTSAAARCRQASRRSALECLRRRIPLARSQRLTHRSADAAKSIRGQSQPIRGPVLASSPLPVLLVAPPCGTSPLPPDPAVTKKDSLLGSTEAARASPCGKDRRSGTRGPSLGKSARTPRDASHRTGTAHTERDPEKESRRTARAKTPWVQQEKPAPRRDVPETDTEPRGVMRAVPMGNDPADCVRGAAEDRAWMGTERRWREPSQMARAAC